MADPPLVGLDPAFDGVLRRDPRDPTRCEYFQDRNKRWPFHCDDDGFELLSRLLVAATPVVAATQAKIEAAHGPGADNIVAEGQQIYAKKPNMGQEDVTWSQREYGHLGLQKEYLRYKSVQRLTEAWACLQRARNSGVFASLTEGPGMEDGDRQTLRWASLGGGPGFELLAVRWFFERHYPAYDLDLVSLDLEGSLAAVRGRSRSAIQRMGRQRRGRAGRCRGGARGLLASVLRPQDVHGQHGMRQVARGQTQRPDTTDARRVGGVQG